MNGKANIYLNIPSIHQKSKSILHFCVRFEFLQNFPWGHGIRRFPPPRPSIELDLFETFLHHGGQRIRSFLGITQQHLRVLLDFFFGCFLEPNKNAFFRNGDICCWLLAGLCFWRFKKGVKESKYNSPTDEFDLVIVEILNDATNMLWR